MKLNVTCLHTATMTIVRARNHAPYKGYVKILRRLQAIGAPSKTSPNRMQLARGTFFGGDQLFYRVR